MLAFLFFTRIVLYPSLFRFLGITSIWFTFSVHSEVKFILHSKIPVFHYLSFEITVIFQYHSLKKWRQLNIVVEWITLFSEQFKPKGTLNSPSCFWLVIAVETEQRTHRVYTRVSLFSSLPPLKNALRRRWFSWYAVILCSFRNCMRFFVFSNLK